MRALQSGLMSVLVVLALLGGGCADNAASADAVGAGDASPSDAGAASPSDAAAGDLTLPDNCEWNAGADEHCVGNEKARAVTCRASGTGLAGKCEYQHSSAGLGNVYCCP